MEGFNSKIIEASKELNAKERVMYKDTSDTISLDDLTNGEEGSAIIGVTDYVLLEVHNERAQGDKDYQTIVLIDSDGERYRTGSNSFIRQFLEIWEEMKDYEEAWGIKVFRKPSRNYNGKEFLTCTVV